MNIGMRWGALCAKAMGWSGADMQAYLDPLDLRSFNYYVYARSCLTSDEFANGCAGLALFTALMGFVECAMHCPLMYHAEGKRTYDAANKKAAFPAWQSLSEASREQWMHCLTSAALKGSIDEVLR